MKVVVLYHPKSEFATDVETFVRDFSYQTGHLPNLVSIESKKGAELADLYDIVDYPAIIVVTEEGRLQNIWQGKILPMINEVQGYILA